MTVRNKHGGKKNRSKKKHNQRVDKTDETNGETPAWQKVGKSGKSNKARGKFQSQPRSVGKRYWRM